MNFIKGILSNAIKMYCRIRNFVCLTFVKAIHATAKVCKTVKDKVALGLEVTVMDYAKTVAGWVMLLSVAVVGWLSLVGFMYCVGYVIGFVCAVVFGATLGIWVALVLVIFANLSLTPDILYTVSMMDKLVKAEEKLDREFAFA